MNTSNSTHESAQDAADSETKQHPGRVKKRKRNRAAQNVSLRLTLHSKLCKKSKEPTQCAKCLLKDTDTWLFSETSQGPVNLCIKCKRQCLEISFGHSAQEEKRLSALKKTLKELKERRKKLPPGSDDTTLKQTIYELDTIIKRGPRPKSTWSPILSGSYGSGKRK